MLASEQEETSSSVLRILDDNGKDYSFASNYILLTSILTRRGFINLNLIYMPRKLLIAVYDKKANHYDNFFITSSIAEAIRSFSIASNDPKTNLNMFPDDFELFKLAEINQDTGIISNVNIEALGLARTYIRTVE